LPGSVGSLDWQEFRFQGRTVKGDFTGNQWRLFICLWDVERGTSRGWVTVEEVLFRVYGPEEYKERALKSLQRDLNKTLAQTERSMRVTLRAGRIRIEILPTQ
jgi:hypothetical protein